jgi:hypothetical protein
VSPVLDWRVLYNAQANTASDIRAAETLNEGWDFNDSHQFAYHAWSTLSHKRWLSKLTPEKVFAVDTSFNLLLRQWTSENLREDWKVAKQQGLVA